MAKKKAEANPLASMLKNTPAEKKKKVTEDVTIEAEVDVVVEAEEIEAGPAALVKKQVDDVAVVVADTAGFGEIAGEVDQDDLIIPRLIQVHGVGDLAQEFDHGSLCINGDVQLMEMKDKKFSEEIQFIPLKAQKVYRENFAYNEAATKDSIPREFSSEQQVLDAGGKVTKWESGQGMFRPAMNLLMAVVMPKEGLDEDLGPYFLDEYGDEVFGIFAMRLAKGAYNSAGKQLLTDYGRVLKRMPGGLPGSRYRMVIENQKKGDNWVWTPVIKRIMKNNPTELVEFFSSLIG